MREDCLKWSHLFHNTQSQEERFCKEQKISVDARYNHTRLNISLSVHDMHMVNLSNNHLYQTLTSFQPKIKPNWNHFLNKQN